MTVPQKVDWAQWDDETMIGSHGHIVWPRTSHSGKMKYEVLIERLPQTEEGAKQLLQELEDEALRMVKDSIEWSREKPSRFKLRAPVPGNLIEYAVGFMGLLNSYLYQPPFVSTITNDTSDAQRLDRYRLVLYKLLREPEAIIFLTYLASGASKNDHKLVLEVE